MLEIDGLHSDLPAAIFLPSREKHAADIEVRPPAIFVFITITSFCFNVDSESQRRSVESIAAERNIPFVHGCHFTVVNPATWPL